MCPSVSESAYCDYVRGEEFYRHRSSSMSKGRSRSTGQRGNSLGILVSFLRTFGRPWRIETNNFPRSISLQHLHCSRNHSSQRSRRRRIPRMIHNMCLRCHRGPGVAQGYSHSIFRGRTEGCQWQGLYGPTE